ncbi:uncharacterized protein Tco025E_02778 [Trypanosoma conorhini]|uniref:Uncharacterized protein n=1 Tax=Trypanosoma conorhini TaxID=83891 RepID=A0A422Q0G9_9TRYP|nr:uncharacterized protein Tco025E_02778 [Trypanosoma conorhini]RNF23486.1 hypothetical protein Tco025E_02778 [Trypanosoma conorhini]
MGGPTRKRAREEAAPTPKTESRGEDEKSAASSSLDVASCATVGEAGGDVAIECAFTCSPESDEENELLAAGENLSGAALKAFLKRNFIDYIDQRATCIPDLEEKEM